MHHGVQLNSCQGRSGVKQKKKKLPTREKPSSPLSSGAFQDGSSESSVFKS